MKVEFLNEYSFFDDQCLLISASEFLKADKDEEEFNSFAFATEAFISTFNNELMYRGRWFITKEEYQYIKSFLKKNEVVLIAAVHVNPSFRVQEHYEPRVYVSSGVRMEEIDLSLVNQ